MKEAMEMLRVIGVGGSDMRRLRNLAIHSFYGIGLYGSAPALSLVWTRSRHHIESPQLVILRSLVAND